jgi:hypothetical protein
MEGVNKFRKNLLDEICSELFEAEYLKKGWFSSLFSFLSIFPNQDVLLDVNKTMNYDRLSSEVATDIRNKTIEEFKAHFLRESDKLHEEMGVSCFFFLIFSSKNTFHFQLSDRMDILKKAKKDLKEGLNADTGSMWLKEETVEDVSKLTYPPRRQVLLNYKQKLLETKEALAAQLEVKH